MDDFNTSSAGFKNIRFLGAEGIGMSALIRILEKQRKLGIQNSDLKISKSDLAYKQNEPMTDDIDLTVASTAIPQHDPDLVWVNKRNIPVWHRSDMLSYLSEPFKQIVATGTHGKTTCSAIISYLLKEGGKEPSFAVGGILSNYASNGDAGAGEYFVLEGDESDKSFIKTKPNIALVTCIEADHLENYPGGFSEIKACFLEFLDRSPYKVLCIDDTTLAEYHAGLKDKSQTLSYSANPSSGADLVLDYSNKQASIQGKTYSLELKIPGKHNALNALGAMAAAYFAGQTWEDSIKLLPGFKGIKRRFELINENYQERGITVYDDYAHHPTELKTLIDSCLELVNYRRSPESHMQDLQSEDECSGLRAHKRGSSEHNAADGGLVIVYQPHHPERTQQFWEDFKTTMQALPAEHLLMVADIYVARSKHIEGVDSKRLVEEIARDNVIYLKPDTTATDIQGNYSDTTAALKPFIDEHLKDGDLLMLAGAGNISKIVENFKM